MNIRNFLFGNDIFICYSRKDGSEYAAELANLLQKQGYSCFVDNMGDTVPSKNLPTSILRNLKNSLVMIVLGTEGASDSIYIPIEIKEFITTKRPIIPIDFDGSLSESQWKYLLEGIATIVETKSALEDATPSESVIYQIIRSLNFTRREKRIGRFAFGTILVFAILLAANFVSFYLVNLQRSSALHRVEEAKRISENLREELSEKDKQLEILNEQFVNANATVNELQRQLAAAKIKNKNNSSFISKQINELNDQLVARNEEVKRLSENLNEKNTQINLINAQLEDEKAKLAELKTKIGDPKPSPINGQQRKEPSIPPWSLVAFLIVIGVLLTYFLTSFILLYVQPLWILALHSKISPKELFDVAGGSAYAKIATLLLTAVGMDYFAKHNKTRQAWLGRYRTDEDTRFSDLHPAIKAEYLKYDDSLDSWVTKRLENALDALKRIAFLKQRNVFVDLSIQVEPEGKLVRKPRSSEFAHLFDLDRNESTLIEIVGRGGSGKSTLAGQFVKWSLDTNERGRLASHLIIPVFIREEITDIEDSIIGHLREMVNNPYDLDKDIIDQLLRRKRLLIIIDGLSERSDAMQSAVRTIFQKTEINSLLITSRLEHDFGTKSLTVLKPTGIKSQEISDFVVAFFEESKFHNEISANKARELAGVVIEVLKTNDSKWSEVTPLIVTLIAEQVVDLWQKRKSFNETSKSAADAIIAYLERVNPQMGTTPNLIPTQVIIDASRILANCCLGSSYTPKDFDKDKALSALNERAFETSSTDIIDRLIKNGVLDNCDSLGTVFLRFNLDTVAEYLAAMYWLDRLRNDENMWKAWLEEISKVEGYPDNMQGFLNALMDCINSHGASFGITNIELPKGKVRQHSSIAEQEAVPSEAVY